MKIIGLDVFYFDPEVGGIVASNDLVVSAIDWVVANRTKFNITAISMSLGAGAYSSKAPCLCMHVVDRASVVNSLADALVRFLCMAAVLEAVSVSLCLSQCVV